MYEYIRINKIIVIFFIGGELEIGVEWATATF